MEDLVPHRPILGSSAPPNSQPQQQQFGRRKRTARRVVVEKNRTVSTTTKWVVAFIVLVLATTTTLVVASIVISNIHRWQSLSSTPSSSSTSSTSCYYMRRLVVRQRSMQQLDMRWQDDEDTWPPPPQPSHNNNNDKNMQLLYHHPSRRQQQQEIRRSSFRVVEQQQQQPELQQPTVSVSTNSGMNSTQPRKQPPQPNRRMMDRSTVTATSVTLLDHFHNALDIHTWMQGWVVHGPKKEPPRDNVVTASSTDNSTTTSVIATTDRNNNNSNKAVTVVPSWDDFADWTSSDETAFLRELGRRHVGTIPTILFYIRHVARHHTVHLYTAALHACMDQKRILQQQQYPLRSWKVVPTTSSVLALHTLVQNACRQILDIMDQHGIRPTSDVLTVLFPAFCGATPLDAMDLRHEIIQRYPMHHTTTTTTSAAPVWTEYVWEAAIYGCITTGCRMAPPPSPPVGRRRWHSNYDGTTRTLDSASQEEEEDNVLDDNSIPIASWNSAVQLYDEWLLDASEFPFHTTTNNNNNNNSSTISQRRVPSERICMALFHVGVATNHVAGVMTFLNRQLESFPSSSSLTEQKTMAGNTTTKLYNSFRMTPRLWAAVLQVCAGTGDHPAAHRVLVGMGTYGQIPNVRHCTTYLKALIEAREIDMAVRFLDYMAAGSGSSSSSSSSVTQKNASEPTNKFGNLRISALPDMIAVKTVLNGCALVGNFTLAQHLLEKIKNGSYGEAIQVDEQCYNMLISTCNDPITVTEIIREMRLTRRHRVGVVLPSAVTYTKAIAVCRKLRDVESARRFLSQARKDGLQPDAFMYSSGTFGNICSL
jgi:pentatricopeptide repeat protein